MAAAPPVIPGIYNSVKKDLLHAIHALFYNQYNMTPPVITEYYQTSTENDLLANIYMLLTGTLPGFLPAGTNSFFIPANVLVDNILVIAPTPVAFSVGGAPGGNDIIGVTPVPARQLFPSPIDGGAAGTTIYFTGVLADTRIKIFTR